jgi:hypothetical protein
MFQAAGWVGGYVSESNPTLNALLRAFYHTLQSVIRPSSVINNLLHGVGYQCCTTDEDSDKVQQGAY